MKLPSLLRAALPLALALFGCVDDGTAQRVSSPAQAAGAARLEAGSTPAEAVARLGSHRFVQNSRIRDLAFTPDGSALLAVADDEACLWDVATGDQRLVFHKQLMCGAMSQDGRTVLLAVNGPAIHVLDTATGQTKFQLTGARNRTLVVALSPDGRRAASGDGGDILVWSLEEPQLLRRLEQKGTYITALQFSPDGHRLAFADHGRGDMWILDLDGDSAPVKLEGGAGFEPWLAFSPDGETLAGSCDVPIPNGDKSFLRFWDTATGRVLREVPGTFEAGAFSPDGRWLAVSGVDQVIVYEASTGKELHRRPVQNQHIWAIAFSQDGKTLATGQDQRTRLWDMDTWQEIAPGRGHSEPIQTIAFAPNGRTIATGGLDGRIIEWSWPEARERRRMEGVGSSWGVQDLTFSPNGQILAAVGLVNNGDPIFLFDEASGRLAARFGKEQPGGFDCPMAFLPDGKEVVIGGTNGSLAVFEVATGKWSRAVGHYGEPIAAVRPLADTNQAWWAGEWNVLGLRDLATGQDVRILTNNSMTWWPDMPLLPDGDWVAMGNRVWNTKTGQALGPDSLALAASSPDGRLLAAAENGGVGIWELLTRKKIHRFELAAGTVRALAFSPDGTVLVTSDYDDAVVWDLTGRLQNGRLPDLALTEEEMVSLGLDLFSEDGWVAQRAAWTLAAGGAASASFLARQMQPAVFDPGQIEALRLGLTNANYDLREVAARELVDLGAELQPKDLESLRRPNPHALRQDAFAGVVASGVSQELLPPPALLPLPGRLRSSRAVMALEHNRAPQAQSLLETLSDGAPQAPQTREAKAALARRRASAPAPASPPRP